MKTVSIYVTTKLVVECDDYTLTPQDIVNDLDYSFESQSSGAVIGDTEIVEFIVVND